MPKRHASSTDLALIPNATRRVSVLLPLPLGTAYDYRQPADMELTPGDFVSVPLGRRQAVGVVWGAGDPAGVEDARLRDVSELLDCPPMPEETRRLVDWVARYTLSPAGAVLRMAMSIPEALQPAPPRVGYGVAEAMPDIRMTAARKRVMAALAGGPPMPARCCGCPCRRTAIPSQNPIQTIRAPVSMPNRRRWRANWPARWRTAFP